MLCGRLQLLCKVGHVHNQSINQHLVDKDRPAKHLSPSGCIYCLENSMSRRDPTGVPCRAQITVAHKHRWKCNAQVIVAEARGQVSIARMLAGAAAAAPSTAATAPVKFSSSTGGSLLLMQLTAKMHCIFGVAIAHYVQAICIGNSGNPKIMLRVFDDFVSLFQFRQAMSKLYPCK